MDHALVVDTVVKRFGDTTAVDGMTFSAARGEILALLGPNGAGKSTLIDMCTGFASPTDGSIRVLGIDPATHPQRVRDRIGIMLQEGGGYSAASVNQMLKLATAYHLNPHDPQWLLELLGLEGVANTSYRRLSGGQRQRLSLALAIIGKPELVFLDEPTAGLDAQSRHAVWEIVEALKHDGTTVVVTTHLMDEAEVLADQVVIVDRGRVVAKGTPAQLIAQEEARADAATITIETAAALDLAALNEVLAPFGLAAEAPRHLHYLIHGAGAPEILAALAAEAARQGVLIRDLAVAHHSLEDVFLSLTGRELRS